MFSKSFLHAAWRGTLPEDLVTGERGVSFDLEDGTTVRLRLSAESAQAIHETFAPGYDAAVRSLVQSAMSSLIPAQGV
jgi:hypothetical protein